MIDPSPVSKTAGKSASLDSTSLSDGKDTTSGSAYRVSALEPMLASASRTDADSPWNIPVSLDRPEEATSQPADSETTQSIAPTVMLSSEQEDAIEREIDKLVTVRQRLPADPDLAPAISKESLCGTLADAAQDHNLPVVFFNNLIWQESRFKIRAVSPVGAQGVAQFMPRTAASMGLHNPFDAFQALPASARLLRDLLGRFGNLGLAAAAYNVGPKRVVDWLSKRSRLPLETRNYVRVITGRPVENWRGRAQTASFRLPSEAPCRSNATVAAADEIARQEEAARKAEQPEKTPVTKAANTKKATLVAQKSAARKIASAKQVPAASRRVLLAAKKTTAPSRKQVAQKKMRTASLAETTTKSRAH